MNRESLDEAMRELRKSREANERAADLLGVMVEMDSGEPARVLDDLDEEDFDDFNCELDDEGEV